MDSRRQPKWIKPYFLIGLTGAPGSGKSEAARFFQEAGALVVQADQLAHEALLDPQVRKTVTEEFGQSILGPGGEIERPRLGAIVFGKPDRLAKLNSILHPEVRKRFERLERNARKDEVIVYEIPLLFETGMEERFHYIIVVSAPEKERLARVQSRSSWTEEEFHARDTAQMPLTEKEKKADLVIINDTDRSALKEKIFEFYRILMEVKPDEEIGK